jgi:hypothetical protein
MQIPVTRKAFSISNAIPAYASAKRTSAYVKAGRSCGIVLTTLLLAGCHYFDTETAGVDGPRAMETTTIVPIDRQKIQNLIANGHGDEERKQLRNEYIGQALRVSDALCEQYKQNVNKISRDVNLGLSSSTTLLGALGAVFTKAAAARPLAGAAGITSGIRANFNDTAFLKQTQATIFNAIANSRNEIRKELELRKVEDEDTFSWLQAVDYLEQYHMRCTLHAAFARLDQDFDLSERKRLEEATDQSAKLRTQIERLREALPKRPPPTE